MQVSDCTSLIIGSWALDVRIQRESLMSEFKESPYCQMSENSKRFQRRQKPTSCVTLKTFLLHIMVGIIKICNLFLAAGGLRSPILRFLFHCQMSGAIELKLSDFVAIFISHILANNCLPGQEVRSGHRNRSHSLNLTCSVVEVWSRAKPKNYSEQNFQSFVSGIVPKTCKSQIFYIGDLWPGHFDDLPIIS